MKYKFKVGDVILFKLFNSGKAKRAKIKKVGGHEFYDYRVRVQKGFMDVWITEKEIEGYDLIFLLQEILEES